MYKSSKYQVVVKDIWAYKKSKWTQTRGYTQPFLFNIYVDDIQIFIFNDTCDKVNNLFHNYYMQMIYYLYRYLSLDLEIVSKS